MNKSLQLALQLTKKFNYKFDKYNYAYGDNLVAAEYCGFQSTPKKINGEWQHGHIGPELNIHTEAVIGSDGLSRTRKNNTYFVQRKDQVDFLESQGYSNVTAIGLPIVYVNNPNVDRIKNSLLIMPTHSLEESDFLVDEESFINSVSSFFEDFDVVLFCIHYNDFKKGYWRRTLERKGIPFIVGANDNDANSLYRLAYIFSHFENIITDTFGSHVAYSSYFGCKVSIIENEWETSDIKRKNLEAISKSHLYKNCPELIDIMHNEWDNMHKKAYPFFYVAPNGSQQNIQWAEFQLGLEHKKNPRELRMLFGWPHPMVFLIKNYYDFITARYKTILSYSKKILFRVN